MGHGMDKDERRDARGRREEGGGRSTDNVGAS
jgi:hypothetical protein